MTGGEFCPGCGAAPRARCFRLPDAALHVGVQWPTAEAARQCPRGDIDLVFCSGCGLIFNQAFDPARLEYAGQYDNSLFFSPRYRQFARDTAERLIDRYSLRGKTVVEIGCGKGDFLRLLCEAGDNRGFGFDPTCDAEDDPGGCVQFIRDYYSPAYARYAPDLICCRQVFEHVPTPRTFLADLRAGVGDRTQTVVYFDVPNARIILRDLHVWSIIYEHCLYFSAESLAAIFRGCGFEILHLRECFGGQFLVVEARPAAGSMAGGAQAPDLNDLIASVTSFAQRFDDCRSRWEERLETIERTGARAVAWGAGARTIGLFNALRIGAQIPYVVDINPRKHGTYLAGTAQQIVDPAFLRNYQPTLVVVMNEIYQDEIRARLRDLDVEAELWCA